MSEGRSTGGKPVNLMQLQNELNAAGVEVGALGMAGDMVYTYDENGAAVDFDAEEQVEVDQVIAEHVGMRDKTDAEYSVEFQDVATTPARKQEIRDITAGLMPRDQVPMEAVTTHPGLPTVEL